MTQTNIQNDTKRTFWSDAARAGCVIGVTVLVITLVKGVFELENHRALFSVLQLVFLLSLMLVLGRRRAARFGNEGYSYAESMKFFLATMLFAGVITGFGNFLVTSVLKPEYYDEIFETTIAHLPLYDTAKQGMEESIELGRRMIHNPFAQTFGGILDMVMYGGLIGLIVSLSLRRRPDIFGGTDNSDGNNAE